MEENIKIIKKHYVFTTNHVLDDQNKQLKQAVENLINKYKEQEKIIELMHEDMKLEGYLKMSKEELYDYYRKRIKLESEDKQ